MKLPQKFQSHAYTQIIENKSSDTGITNVHGGTTHSGQKVKTTKCTLTDEWINKCEVYIHIYIYISHDHDIIHP